MSLTSKSGKKGKNQFVKIRMSLIVDFSEPNGLFHLYIHLILLPQSDKVVVPAMRPIISNAGITFAVHQPSKNETRRYNVKLEIASDVLHCGADIMALAVMDLVRGHDNELPSDDAVSQQFFVQQPHDGYFVWFNQWIIYELPDIHSVVDHIFLNSSLSIAVVFAVLRFAETPK